MTQLPPELLKALEMLVNPTILIVAFAVSLRLLPILLFTSLGELIAEKSGVVNLGVEGIMLFGAFTAYIVTIATGDPFAGLGSAIAMGTLVTAVFAYTAVILGINQAVAGLGIWLLGLGLTGVLYTTVAPIGATVSTIKSPLDVDTLISYVGSREAAELLVSLTNPLVVVSIAIVPATHIFLIKTRWGLVVSSVGEDPLSSDALGINVARVRFLSTLYGGILASISGAYLSISYLGDFRYGVTAGRGFMALAMVYAGNWDPVRTFLSAALLSFIDALQLAIASSSIELARRYYFFNMIPYIAVILLVLILGRKARPPSGLMKHFRKG